EDDSHAAAAGKRRAMRLKSGLTRPAQYCRAMRLSFLLVCTAFAGAGRADGLPDQPGGGPLDGRIGVVVRSVPSGVIVNRVDAAAAQAGVHPGDRVLTVNGEPVSTVREFNRRVLEARPGSALELELRRADVPHTLHLPVREVDT